MLKKILSLCLIAFMLIACVSAVAESPAGSLPTQEMSAMIDDSQAFAVQFANDLMGGEKNEELYAMFLDEVKAQLPREAFDTMWSQVTGMFGDFESFGNYKFENVQGHSTHLLQMNMSKQKLLLQLTLDSSGKITGLFFKDGRLLDTPAELEAASQEVPLPDGLVEEEVTVGEGEWALPGLLTLPKDGLNLPAVVLVHGSGAGNRDEEVGQTKMFRDLAWALAQKGIASIRYDKRTRAHGEKFTPELVKTLTVREETIIDAVLAGNVLKSDSRIDSGKVFVAGHSLGAMLGPRIVKESEGLFAGMILMSGSPLQLTDISLSQNEDLLAQLTEEQRKTQQPLVDAEVDKLKGIDSMTDDQLKAETFFGLPGWYVKDLRSYDAAATVKELQLPTFILQGGADFQVSLTNGFEAWQAAVGGETYVTLKLYPELNHMLMKYTGDSAYQFSIQEYDTPAKLDETAANDLAAWVLTH